jgi:hypothetical protein
MPKIQNCAILSVLLICVKSLEFSSPNVDDAGVTSFPLEVQLEGTPTFTYMFNLSINGTRLSLQSLSVNDTVQVTLTDKQTFPSASEYRRTTIKKLLKRKGFIDLKWDNPTKTCPIDVVTGDVYCSTTISFYFPRYQRSTSGYLFHLRYNKPHPKRSRLFPSTMFTNSTPAHCINATEPWPAGTAYNRTFELVESCTSKARAIAFDTTPALVIRSINKVNFPFPSTAIFISWTCSLYADQPDKRVNTLFRFNWTLPTYLETSVYSCVPYPKSMIPADLLQPQQAQPECEASLVLLRDNSTLWSIPIYKGIAKVVRDVPASQGVYVTVGFFAFAIIICIVAIGYYIHRQHVSYSTVQDPGYEMEGV